MTRKKKPVAAVLADPNELLTAAEVVAALGNAVSQEKVRRMAAEDRLAGAKKYGKTWLIPRSAIASIKVRGKGRPLAID